MTDGYLFVLASEGYPRDGMGFELHRVDPRERVAEVFEDDETQVRTFGAFTLEPVPVESVEELIERARTEL